ncbi:MAG: hypothetical protein QM504_17415 [Pseudomonadota bacterium]
MHKFSRRILALENTGKNKLFFLMLFKPHTVDNFHHQLKNIDQTINVSGTIVLMDGLSLIAPKIIKYNPLDKETFKNELQAYSCTLDKVINKLEYKL